MLNAIHNVFNKIKIEIDKAGYALYSQKTLKVLHQSSNISSKFCIL